MCTAVSYTAKDHYFGRNLDLEFSYHEEIAIMPRKFPLIFRHTRAMPEHYAMIGVATMDGNYPLYYDASNEFGLSIAGLNFPEFSHYQQVVDCTVNIAPFELIPWILGQCKTTDEAKNLLKGVQIADIEYSDKYPITPMHWIISDRHKSIVLEPVKEGLHILDNPVGVLTNSPPFEFHMQNLRQYINITNDEPVSHFADSILLKPYTRGIGGFGIPGDLSSPSRFIRAAFTALNSVSNGEENESVSQFFHILHAVEQQRGCVRINNNYEITVYSSCCNTDKGIYYYTTYENSQITAIHMHNENLGGSTVTTHPLIRTASILNQNK